MKTYSWLYKLIALAAIIGALLWFNQSVLHLSPQTIQQWILSFGWAAPVLYILIYTLRPLILFPASVLSLTGGLAFGPLLGTLYTIIGATLGAVLSFTVARYMGKRFVQKKWTGRWQHVEKQLEEKGFIYMLVLRLIPLLPFDLISYAAGVSKVRLSAFLLATMLGILPGTFAYNFLGSSFVEGKMYVIVIAVIIFVIILLLPLLLRNKLSILKDEGPVKKKEETTDEKL